MHLSTKELSPPSASDYTALSETLTFEPSMDADTTICRPVVIHDDREVEGAEFFHVRLTSDDPMVILEPDSAQITITEGDGMSHDMSHDMLVSCEGLTDFLQLCAMPTIWIPPVDYTSGQILTPARWPSSPVLWVESLPGSAL